ncbi:phasin family protein [Hyphomonas jannaschiana]|uniref:NADH dehydrogenase subunit E n=1 Tax=Hyphomonas jannaschiana VP2 TaxID=1280952 RepID=A0A059F8R8_9PROT|nr:phasin family protein [Hyphomonas jannaschiana]KCZ86971.1 NADH dehydrogenase subunit E [Hyphomonas jannaschiana VP2]
MAKDKKTKAKKTKKSEAGAKAVKTAKAIEAQSVEMAHKIWLAGVGAYGKAYDTALANANTFNKQSTELFDELVKRGEKIESDVKTRFGEDERVTKATKTVAKANAAARQFQAEAYDRFEARMERMRDLLGVKQMNERTSKLASKIEKLEDEVAETVASAKDRVSKVDLKARIARLSAEIEAVAGETGADIAKTAKKAAGKTSKAMKAAVAMPEASDDLSQITGVGPAMVKKLNAAGIYSFAQLAALKKAEAEKLDEQIGARGRVTRDEWVKQAKALAKK